MVLASAGRPKLRLLACCSLSLAAGCTSYEAAPIDLDRLPRERAARSLTTPELRSFVEAFLGGALAAWPPAALDLQQLQAIALFHRSELKMARAQLRAFEAAHAVADQLPNPKLMVGPGVVTNPAGASRWLTNIGLMFPLDLSGQRSARAEAAASEVAAARLGVAQADQSIRADVAQRAFELDLQQQLGVLAQQQTALRRQLAALADKRVAAGAAAAGEAAAARAAVARAELAVASATRATAAARTALAAALGLPVEALAGSTLLLPEAAPDLDAAAAQPMAACAVRQRLDVAEVLCGYARREAELRLEVARQWPDLELGPGYEYDQGLHKFRLDVGFTLPLFHGNGAAIEQATAARATAAVAVEVAQTRAITEIEAALQQFTDQRSELAATLTLVATTADAVAMAQRRAGIGADDYNAVTAANVDAVDARILLAQQRHAAQMAWLRLEQALQQPIGDGLLAWQHAVPETNP